MERHFDEELRDLKGRILYMGSVVEKMIDMSAEGLLQQNEKMVSEIWKLEEEINHLQIELDETCLKLIALRQPAGVDLRFITSTMRINSELERIADQSINIMQNTTILLKSREFKITDKFSKMVETIKSMLHTVLDSFVHKDIELAKSVLVRDAEVDKLKRETLQELIDCMISNSTKVTGAIELILIARNLERIGDHSTNIAEDVIFAAVGKDVRHHVTEIS